MIYRTNILASIWLLLLPLSMASASQELVKIPKTTTNKPALSMRQIADQCLSAVVLITVRGGDGQIEKSGSGFVIAKDEIVTNIHVVQNAYEVTINFPSGHSVEALGTVNEDTTSDLAILFADTTGVKPLKLATDPPHVGDGVVALGSPEGLTGFMSSGIISGLRMMPGTKVLQTTAPISHGSSGGPLLDDHGEVLGVTSFMLQDGQNLNFAYPAYFLKVLLLTEPDNYLTWDGSTRVWRVELERTIGLRLVLTAFDYLPHERMAKTVNQLDASGFLQSIYAAVGLYLPRDAQAQATIGYDVARTDWSQWLAGDRLYFACNHSRIDHTGMYIGGGKFIHLALNTKHQIVTERVDDSYFASHLICVRRSQELLYEPLPVPK